MSVETLWEDLAQGSFTILKLVVFRQTKNKSGQLQSYFPAGQHLLEKCKFTCCKPSPMHTLALRPSKEENWFIIDEF